MASNDNPLSIILGGILDSVSDRMKEDRIRKEDRADVADERKWKEKQTREAGYQADMTQQGKERRQAEAALDLKDQEKSESLKSWAAIIQQESPELWAGLNEGGTYQDMDPKAVEARLGEDRKQRAVTAKNEYDLTRPLTRPEQLAADNQKFYQEKATLELQRKTMDELQSAVESLSSYEGDEVWEEANKNAAIQAVNESGGMLMISAVEDPPGYITFKAVPRMKEGIERTPMTGDTGMDESAAYSQSAPAAAGPSALASEADTPQGSGVSGSNTLVDDFMKFIGGGFSPR